MYTFKLRLRTYSAETLPGISLIYCQSRDASGEDARTFPMPVVYRVSRKTLLAEMIEA